MTARNFISLLVFYLFALTNTFGQAREDKSAILHNIKKSCQEINSYKSYKILTIDNAEEFLKNNPDNGASLKGYYKSGSLKKIIEWIGLSNKIIQNEYYFGKGKLIFVYATESRYDYNDSLQALDYSKLHLFFKGRYYFNNEKLFDTIVDDKEPNVCNQKDASDFLVTSKEYAKLLKAKGT